MANLTESFEISLIGDVTKEKWAGKFSAKTRLSHRDELLRDRLRRDFLGPNSQDASERAKLQAFILSELKVRLAETPSWWAAKGEGLDLSDDNVIMEIYEKALAIENKAIEELKTEGEEAVKALQKVARENG